MKAFILSTALLVAVSGLLVQADTMTTDEKFRSEVGEALKVMEFTQLQKAMYLLTKKDRYDMIQLPDLPTNAAPLVTGNDVIPQSMVYFESLAAVAHSLDLIAHSLDLMEQRDKALAAALEAYAKAGYRTKTEEFPRIMRILQFTIGQKQIDKANQLVKIVNDSMTDLNLLYEMAALLHQNQEMSSSLNTTIERLKTLSRTVDERLLLATKLYGWRMNEHALIVMRETLPRLSSAEHYQLFSELAYANQDQEMFTQGIEEWRKWCSRYESFQNLLFFMESKSVPAEKRQTVIRDMYKKARKFEHYHTLIQKCIAAGWGDLALEIQDPMIEEFNFSRLDIDYRALPNPDFLYTASQMPSGELIDVFTYTGALNEKLGERSYADTAYRKGLRIDAWEYLYYGGFQLTGNLNRFFYYYNFAAKEKDAESLRYMKLMDPWVTAIETGRLDILRRIKAEKNTELAALLKQPVPADDRPVKTPRFIPGHLPRLIQALVVCGLAWLVFFLFDVPVRRESGKGGA